MFTLLLATWASEDATSWWQVIFPPYSSSCFEGRGFRQYNMALQLVRLFLATCYATEECLISVTKGAEPQLVEEALKLFHAVLIPGNRSTGSGKALRRILSLGGLLNATDYSKAFVEHVWAAHNKSRSLGGEGGDGGEPPYPACRWPGCYNPSTEDCSGSCVTEAERMTVSSDEADVRVLRGLDGQWIDAVQTARDKLPALGAILDSIRGTVFFPYPTLVEQGISAQDPDYFDCVGQWEPEEPVAVGW